MTTGARDAQLRRRLRRRERDLVADWDRYGFADPDAHLEDGAVTVWLESDAPGGIPSLARARCPLPQ